MASISAIDGAIQKKKERKKMCGRGALTTSRAVVVTTGKGITLVISNKDMGDIIIIMKLLETSGVLIDGISEAIKHEVKKQKGGFLDILLGTLGASMLGNMLTGKGVIRARRGYNNIDQLGQKF